MTPSDHGSARAGLPIGSEVPEFTLAGLYGETMTLDSLRSSGKPVMLVFTDPNCGPCNILLPEIGRWQEEHSEKLTLSLVSRGEPEENRSKAQEQGLHNLLLQEGWEVAGSYRVAGTPSAVLLGPDGNTASRVASGPDAICGLVGDVLMAHAPITVTRKIGENAPELILPDLQGNQVRLEHFRGEETLVLFWNPGCGFCQQMLPELREWEEDPSEGAPRLLVVSAGTWQANSQQGLSSTMVLDQQFSAGRAFGASGTPSAVLVDAKGRVASELAIGAPAVLELAKVRRTEA